MATFVPTPFASPIIVPNAVAGDAFRRIPYVSVSEYRFAPTAVSTGALVPGSQSPIQSSAASLANVIMRASSWVDEVCFHRSNGTLAASITTEWDYPKIKPDGSIALICNFKPVIEVVGIGVGPNPATVQNVTSNVAGSLFVDDKVIWLQGVGAGTPLPWFGSWPSSSGRVYAVWQYVNGFPHASLAQSASVGATSITVTPAVPALVPSGVYAGTRLTIKDGQKTETVTVETTPTSNTLVLASGLKFAHTPPPDTTPDSILVSALPWQIEQATISLTSVLIKAQGARSQTLGEIGKPPTRVAASRAGATEDYDNAMALLKPFVTVYLH